MNYIFDQICLYFLCIDFWVKVQLISIKFPLKKMKIMIYLKERMLELDAISSKYLNMKKKE